MTTYYKKTGRSYVEVNPLVELDMGIMIMGAVRYTLGRSSYSPGSVMDWCRANWAGISINTRHVIMRDVMEWLGQRHEWVVEGTHDSAWPEAWRDFLRWCFAQDKDAAMSAARANVWQRDRMQGVDEFFEVLR